MAHLLLDTHIILYALSEPERLDEAAREMLEDPENDVFFSPISVWEVAIKHDKHPEDMPVSAERVRAYCEEAGYRELALTADQVCALPTLDEVANGPSHKDPFDRMLMSQALAKDMVFLTRDSDILAYGFENMARA